MGEDNISGKIELKSLWLAVFSALALLALTCSPASEQEMSWKKQRKRMAKMQLENRDIEQPQVLNAMRRVQRHLFVPEDYRNLAYADQALPIGHGQTISQPYIVALMTQLADIQGEDKVLEIGTGSGYQAAVLSRLAKEVYSIEIITELSQEAQKRLKNLGYSNVRVRTGDGFKGWPKHAPFDSILVTCAPPEIPKPLQNQLAVGGRIVIPVGKDTQKLKLVQKQKNGELETKNILAVRFVPMIGPQVQKPTN